MFKVVKQRELMLMRCDIVYIQIYIMISLLKVGHFNTTRVIPYKCFGSNISENVNDVVNVYDFYKESALY